MPAVLHSKGAVSYSPGLPVPSAPRGLTSLFGMGGGVDPPRHRRLAFFLPSRSLACGRRVPQRHDFRKRKSALVPSRKAFGLLVPLGFAIADFAPAAYRRRRLRRPSRRSNLGAGFALRCFQRLSLPDAATRPCTWRYNRLTGGLSGTVLSY